MTKVYGHQYKGNVLSYEVETRTGRSIVAAEQMTDYEAISEYWKAYAAKHAPKKNKTPLFGTKIKTPKRIVDIKTVGEKRYVLCEFDGLDTPVLVKTELVRNAWPKMFIDFCEQRIAKSEV